jgi:hypothetical protein
MAGSTSPLVGYNNNVRHKGKLYHIQTEDSGVARPHIITHLFADGGRIIASKKTDYAQHLASENLGEVVRKLMQEQHKAMAIALRDGLHDEAEAVAEPVPDAAPSVILDVKAPELDLDALERAAEAKLAQSAAARARKPSGPHARTRDRKSVPPRPPSQRPKPPSQRPSKMPARPSPGSVRDAQPANSLDEMILSYLADDSVDRKR